MNQIKRREGKKFLNCETFHCHANFDLFRDSWDTYWLAVEDRLPGLESQPCLLNCLLSYFNYNIVIQNDLNVMILGMVWNDVGLSCDEQLKK